MEYIHIALLIYVQLKCPKYTTETVLNYGKVIEALKYNVFRMKLGSGFTTRIYPIKCKQKGH